MAFTKIVCGIDGNPPALEGVRQAAALASAGSTIELVAVSDDWADGSAAQLAQARAVLADSPFDVVSRPLDSEGQYVWQKLLAAADGADLLVVGRRAEVVIPPGVVANVLHRAELPVLVAVKPPHGQSFPGRILVAAEGPGHPEDAVRLASEIAGGSATSDVILLRATHPSSAKQPAVAAARAALIEATGVPPIELVVNGQPHRAIVDYSKLERASLVLTVSERVAHQLPCSVLVVSGAAQPLRDLPYA
jgi:nucleotide-binding universal stress UspA family protein